jgi:hypothetical protein
MIGAQRTSNVMTGHAAIRTGQRRRVHGADVARVAAALAPDDALDGDGEVEVRRRLGQAAHGLAAGRQADHGEDREGQADREASRETGHRNS